MTFKCNEVAIDRLNILHFIIAMASAADILYHTESLGIQFIWYCSVQQIKCSRFPRRQLSVRLLEKAKLAISFQQFRSNPSRTVLWAVRGGFG